MPAQKKHASVRARANRAATAATLPAAGRAGAAPLLPQLDDREWSPLTLAWWRDLWSSPMSTEYHQSDSHQIVVLAMLMDDFFTATSRTMRTAISAEIRQHRQAFGLTPYDRRRLEWQIETTEDAKDRGRARRERSTTAPSKAAQPATDPRSILRAVN